MGIASPSMGNPLGLHILAPPDHPAGRLEAFDLKIRSGQVSSLPDSPDGWRVIVENLLSGRAHVTGRSIVDSSGVSFSAIERILRLTPDVRGHVRPGVDPAIAVSGALTVEDDRGDEITRNYPRLELAP